MALKKIIAKDLVTISSGEEVSFITTDTGTIVLLSGFRAFVGSEFKAYMKDLTNCTRACGDYCTTAYMYPKLSRLYDAYLSIYDLLYTVKIEYEIYDIYYTLHYCTGLKSDYKHKFIVRDLKVNHAPPNDEFEEIDNLDTLQTSSSALLNIQDENAPPSFTIIPK